LFCLLFLDAPLQIHQTCLHLSVQLASYRFYLGVYVALFQPEILTNKGPPLLLLRNNWP
jgi:hypothetical protein